MNIITKALKYKIDILLIVISVLIVFILTHGFGWFVAWSLAAILEILFILFIKPSLKAIICLYTDNKIRAAYNEFNTEINKKVLEIYNMKDTHPEKADWQIHRTNLDLILSRATSEISERANRDVIDNFKNDILKYRPRSIIATNTSPLSLWFHHVITTYFVAQTRDLAKNSEGLEVFTRLYLITDKELLNGIRFTNDILFDYWNAADEMHKIANKKLYVVYRKDFNFSFRNVGGVDQDKLLIYVSPDKSITAIRSFGKDEYKKLSSSVVDDKSHIDSYNYFLNTLRQYAEQAITVNRKEEFFDRIDSLRHDIVVWKVY